METAPIHHQAAQMQLGQAGQDHGPIVLTGLQGGQNQPVLAKGGWAWGGIAAQGLPGQTHQAGPGT